MSAPISFASSPATVAPATVSAGSGSSFDDVLSEFTGESTEEMIDAMLASGSGPSGGALLAGLNLPIGDARALTGATGDSELVAGGGVPAPISGVGGPASASGLLTPAQGQALAGQPDAFAMPGRQAGTTVRATQTAPGTPGVPTPGIPAAGSVAANAIPATGVPVAAGPAAAFAAAPAAGSAATGPSAGFAAAGPTTLAAAGPTTLAATGPTTLAATGPATLAATGPGAGFAATGPATLAATGPATGSATASAATLAATGPAAGSVAGSAATGPAAALTATGPAAGSAAGLAATGSAATLAAAATGAPSTSDAAMSTVATPAQAGQPNLAAPAGDARDRPTGLAPAAQGAAGAAAAAGLTGTLANQVAGTAVTAAQAAPGTQGVSPADRVSRTAMSTVDTGVPMGPGSTVDIPIRSGNTFAGDTSGQDRDDGALPRGPDGAFTPTLAAARTDSAAATTPASPTSTQATTQPQLPPAAQLALRLAPLRSGPDGTHQLTIVLYPEELGPVSVVATVKGDQLSVRLAGATDAGREALRAALPELERDLRAGGFATLHLDVRDSPQPDPVRPAWAAARPVEPAVADGPDPSRPAASQQTPSVTPVPVTATDTATNGTATTTGGAKTDSQPIGHPVQPDGMTPNRRDDGTGQYNAAGMVTATHQSSGAGFGNSAGTLAQQQPAQLNPGQPGGEGFGDPAGQQPADAGHADRGGHHPGGGPDNALPAPEFEPDPRVAENHRITDRTGTRSLDLRV